MFGSWYLISVVHFLCVGGWVGGCTCVCACECVGVCVGEHSPKFANIAIVLVPHRILGLQS